MINQGEKVVFSGKFSQESNGVVTDLILTGYVIKARICNPKTSTILNFTSGNVGEGEIPISISAVDNMTYNFQLEGTQTALMIGDCTCEMALINTTDSNAIIANNKATFSINPSDFGKSIVSSN